MNNILLRHFQPLLRIYKIDLHNIIFHHIFAYVKKTASVSLHVSPFSFGVVFFTFNALEENG